MTTSSPCFRKSPSRCAIRSGALSMPGTIATVMVWLTATPPLADVVPGTWQPDSSSTADMPASMIRTAETRAQARTGRMRLLLAHEGAESDVRGTRVVRHDILVSLGSAATVVQYQFFLGIRVLMCVGEVRRYSWPGCAATLSTQKLLPGRGVPCRFRCGASMS